MMKTMYGALIASLGVVALMLAADTSFAAAPRGGVSSTHFHPRFARPFRHHHKNFNNNNNAGVFWGDGGFFYEPPGGSGADLGQLIPEGIRNSNAFDIPWDWVHRYPPLVVPSDKPYVSTCPTETVTVPGRGGGPDQTVNIMRCY
jgi:hypothetical protein